MRRVWLCAVLGVGLLVVSIPLWNVARATDCEAAPVPTERRPGVPLCDGRLHLPSGDLALLFTVLGFAALVAAATLCVATIRMRELRPAA